MLSGSHLTRHAGASTLIVIALLIGCSSSAPNAPTPATANVAGIWANGDYRWDLSQTGTSVSGVETSTFPPGIYGADSGTITGSVSGAVFTVDQTMQRARDSGTLHYHVQGQLTVNQGSMSGQLTYIPLWDARTITQEVHFVRLSTKP